MIVDNKKTDARTTLLRRMDNLISRGKITVEGLLISIGADKGFALAALDDIRIASIKTRDGFWTVTHEAVVRHKEAAEKVLNDGALYWITTDDGFKAGDIAWDIVGEMGGYYRGGITEKKSNADDAEDVQRAD